ncbi:ubiquitin-conjugating enzyme e2 34 [Nicotiana attenuata]|uniref:Ubiquitin-conjugating enzyme e2 34 n=1 Tax=Nicotiana attenuata TaxID=49451 RepID=A0A1J6KQ24_NICAT|nr:ubiquitin-conjugating enzyme e2 34 [Nicotiana attenuata]
MNNSFCNLKIIAFTEYYALYACQCSPCDPSSETAGEAEMPVKWFEDYILEGSEGTPFAGGYYYGKIKFLPEYPFKPLGISMTTPNGRFMTQKKICLSMSDCKCLSPLLAAVGIIVVCVTC